eukprot:CAMPEP_0168518708 /NCGR_PEP_ID=MMETSP0405-20121227/6878_1 /TAXON_ID=498012 /ORGANISM="Trichosphaerium sp, Strain Am-I-7 wt" /LENGTH=858 /DNA_ID=CAMNT_0008539101 /DNA_START=52 /DNA_END=2628 /DNA_ORIENTATION=-
MAYNQLRDSNYTNGGKPPLSPVRDGSSASNDINLLEKIEAANHLHQHVDHVRAQLEKLVQSASDMRKHFDEMNRHAMEFHSQLQNFTFEPESRDPPDENLLKCSTILLETHQLYGQYMDKFQDVFIQPTQTFIAGQMSDDQLKELQKQALQARDDYDAIQRKINMGKKAKSRSSRKMDNASDIASELEDSRRLFNKLSGAYISKLREVKAISRFDIIQSLCGACISSHAHYRQGNRIMDDSVGGLDQIRLNMEASKTSYLESIANGELQEDSGERKQGYIFYFSKKAWHLRWCRLSESRGLLNIYKNMKANKEIESLELILSTLKPLEVAIGQEPYCFELWTPQRKLLFRAMNEEDFNSWCNGITNVIKKSVSGGRIEYGTKNPIPERQMSMSTIARVPDSFEMPTSARTCILDSLWEIPGNTVCADCGNKNPNWVSINLGILLCINCCGVHRSLGTHISKVRSLEMDTLSPQQLNFVTKMGNEKANKIFEQNLRQGLKPKENARRPESEAFINEKYIAKKYIEKTSNNNLEKAFMDACMAEDLPKIVKLIAQGVNIKWRNKQDRDRSFAHYLIKGAKLNALELLLLNGLPPHVKDTNGDTLLHTCILEGNGDVLLYILAKKLNRESTNVNGMTPEDLLHDELLKTPKGENLLTMQDIFKELKEMELEAQNASIDEVSFGTKTKKPKQKRKKSFLRSKDLSRTRRSVSEAPLKKSTIALDIGAPVISNSTQEKINTMAVKVPMIPSKNAKLAREREKREREQKVKNRLKANPKAMVRRGRKLNVKEFKESSNPAMFKQKSTSALPRRAPESSSSLYKKTSISARSTPSVPVINEKKSPSTRTPRSNGKSNFNLSYRKT